MKPVKENDSQGRERQRDRAARRDLSGRAVARPATSSCAAHIQPYLNRGRPDRGAPDDLLQAKRGGRAWTLTDVSATETNCGGQR